MLARTHQLPLSALVLALGMGCGPEPPARPAAWEQAARAASLSIPLVCGGDLQHKATILEVNGNGLGLLDVDSDGDLDLLLLDGTTRAGLLADRRVRHHLLINRGPSDGLPRFQPQQGHGLEMDGWPTGLAIGDVDRDGRPDVAIGALGGDVLFLNRTAPGGPARFEGLPLPSRRGPRDWTTSLALADADDDGLLDLYLARYLEIDPQHPPMDQIAGLPCRFAGQLVMCGPLGLPAQPDVLLAGLPGPPWFREASDESGIGATTPAYGLGVLFTDLDGDGRPDLYVANDSVDNFVLHNIGGGRFDHVGRLSGAASDRAGRAQAGMGVACGDLDGDGDLDLAVTNFSEEANALYRNDGGLLFRETSAAAGTGSVSRPLLGWGVQLADFDSDGTTDLFVSNGHVYPEADRPGTGTRYAQPLLLQPGLGDGRFGPSSPPIPGAFVARANVRGDLDGDGDLDLIVLQLDGTPLLLINHTDAPERQLLVRLEDVPPHASDALGAVLRLRVDGRWLTDARLSSSAFQSASDPRLHFGGGGRVTAAEVCWPGGAREQLDPSPFRFGRLLVLRRGAGVVSSRELRAVP